MRSQFAPPDLPGYRNNKRTTFQIKCNQILNESLRSKPCESCHQLVISFFTVNRKNNSDIVQAIQIHSSDWTVHVQCLLHGDEMDKVKFQRLGLSHQHVLISLDVERGPSSDAIYDKSQIDRLQESIVGTIANKVNDNLPNAFLDLDHIYKEHVVFEMIPYSDNDDCIEQVCRKMLEYIDLFWLDAMNAFEVTKSTF
ncbi:MAG: hypothetical protein ACYC27_14265 [Armatimonadota bacterium]